MIKLTFGHWVWLSLTGNLNVIIRPLIDFSGVVMPSNTVEKHRLILDKIVKKIHALPAYIYNKYNSYYAMK